MNERKKQVLRELVSCGRFVSFLFFIMSLQFLKDGWAAIPAIIAFTFFGFLVGVFSAALLMLLDKARGQNAEININSLKRETDLSDCPVTASLDHDECDHDE